MGSVKVDELEILDDDQNEFDVEKPKRGKKKTVPQVYHAKVIMRSKNYVGVLFKGFGLRINTERVFPEEYIDVYYVNDIGNPKFECWLQ